ncbi:hypothetical protein [Lyngbya confervoides]|uniref:Uncharacterized protein n=1 Tax=Lyngbya confervoides BDU141951 TaxID=1574623 RepID=A0ABD4T2R2_9CYAN|nr:hypothetical protein [Lyngbya confervoides]MCM1983027.1 hypothetical protein [Lyngbya confervoides BDU141951]
MPEQLIQLVAYKDWIIGVTHAGPAHYACWVITPEAIALNDGEIYSCAAEAMTSGRMLVLMSVD